MKKRGLMCVLAAGILAAALTGCSGGETSESAAGSSQAADSTAAAEAESSGEAEAAAPAEKFVMQIGHAQAETSPRHVSLESFKKAVEEQTNGGIEVQIYPAGQLGDETEMTEAVAMGTLQAVRGGDLEYLPQITMLSLPLLFDNMEEVHKVFYSDFVAEKLTTVESEHGMKVLAIGDDSGFRQITNNKRRITSPDDMKDLKMRTVLEIMTLSMEAYGASAVSVPFTDLYMAMKTGVCDGQENPLALIDNQKFYEVQPYISIIDYMVCAEVMYVNLEWFNSLPAEYQEILTTCARDMMDETSEIVEADNEKYIQTLTDYGCDVYTLTEEERESFRPASEEVWKEYIELGRMTREDLDAMLEILGKTVSW